MPRTGSWGAGESDDHPPDTTTRQGTEQARQIAADALTAWIREHPETVIVNHAAVRRERVMLGDGEALCVGTADDFRETAELLGEAAS